MVKNRNYPYYEIRRLCNDNMKLKDIAKLFMISDTQVGRTCNFQRWK